MAVFSDIEIFTFIAIVEESNSYSTIDGRKPKNKEVFNMLAQKTSERHKDLTVKTGEQWRGKWKKLKATYMVEKQNTSKSGSAPSSWRLYTEMEKVQGHRPISNAISADLDELDRSNAEETAAATTTDVGEVAMSPEARRTPTPGTSTPAHSTSRRKRLRNSSSSSSSSSSVVQVLQEIENKRATQLDSVMQSMRESMQESMRESQHQFLTGMESMLGRLISHTASANQFQSSPQSFTPQPLHIPFPQSSQSVYTSQPLHNPSSQPSHSFCTARPLQSTSQPSHSHLLPSTSSAQASSYSTFTPLETCSPSDADKWKGKFHILDDFN